MLLLVVGGWGRWHGRVLLSQQQQSGGGEDVVLLDGGGHDEEQEAGRAVSELELLHDRLQAQASEAQRLAAVLEQLR